MAGQAPNKPLYKHASPYKEFRRRYREHWTKREFLSAVFLSSVFFAASVAISFFAIQYATERASNSVTDIILSNTTPMNVDGFFVFGTLFLVLFVLLVLIAHPKRIPFTLYSLGFFYIIRSLFISLTHIGPFPIPPDVTDWGIIAAHFLFGSDLFFSGHTGVPFLLALIFWREKGLRNMFLAWSVYMATIVLLGHYHYSIDVASAFFITYTIFHISEWLFPRSRALFLRDEEQVK